MASGQSFAAQLTAPVALVMELLLWVAARPRTYGETMEAWRTSCPRMPVWGGRHRPRSRRGRPG
jgi:hypothetical protein